MVNHLDKFEEMSDGQFKPKVIIRTCIGSRDPLMPGPQHCQNHSDSFRKMLTNISVVELMSSSQIIPVYEGVIKSDKSSIIVEYADNYNDE